MTENAGWLMALALMWLTVACDKKDESSGAPATVASSVAPSAPPTTAKVVKFMIATTGKTAIDMPATNEHIKADTTAAAGDLQIDLMHLANSRGEVKVDLTTLKTHTFPEADKNSTQTEHAWGGRRLEAHERRRDVQEPAPHRARRPRGQAARSHRFAHPGRLQHHPPGQGRRDGGRHSRPALDARSLSIGS